MNTFSSSSHCSSDGSKFCFSSAMLQYIVLHAQISFVLFVYSLWWTLEAAERVDDGSFEHTRLVWSGGGSQRGPWKKSTAAAAAAHPGLAGGCGSCCASPSRAPWPFHLLTILAAAAIAALVHTVIADSAPVTVTALAKAFFLSLMVHHTRPYVGYLQTQK